jgi:hypothetical protein
VTVDEASERDDADSRRQKPISVEKYADRVWHLTIDGKLWAAVEWSKNNLRFCIEDAEGRCLSHRDHVHGGDEDRTAAIALAKEMIRDGRMPTPEAAKKVREDRLERRRQTSSAKRRREQREQSRKEWHRLFEAENEAEERDEEATPLYEVVLNTLDLTDPELWRSNSFAALRERLILSVQYEIAKLEMASYYEGRTNPERLNRASEILRLLTRVPETASTSLPD